MTRACTALLVLAALGASACGSSDSDTKTSASTAGGPEEVSLSIGMLPVAGAAPVRLGEQEGIYRRHGLKVSETPLQTPADAIPNVLGGRQHVGLVNPGTIAAALAQKLPVKIIGTLYYANGEHKIYVKQDSPIRTIADLKGKTIGLIQLRNTAQATVMEQLRRAGVDPGDVKFTLIPAPDMPNVLESGRIDAGQILEPLATAAGDRIRPLIDDVFAPLGDKPVLAYQFTSEEFAKEQPDAVARYQAAMTEANELAATDPQATREAIASLTRIPPELLRKMPLPAFGNELKLDSSQAQVDLMVEYGLLDESVDLRSAALTP